MSRTLPNECAHGYIFDWADFRCECAGAGICADTDEHNPVEWCPQGCNDAAPRTGAP